MQGGLAMLLDCLRSLAGPKATIAVPAYRLGADKSEVFDRAFNPSLKVGAFSEHVRLLPGAVRTANPLHSHSFVGPLAQNFVHDRVRPSFGPQSDFAFFVEEKFTCLCLGCDLENAGTFVFHAQALAGNIPYRSWQTLSRTCADSRAGVTPQIRDFDYYARIEGVPREQRRTLELLMAEAGQLRRANAQYGSSLSFACRPACEFLVDTFQRNPLVCVEASGIQS
jgi:aminoglycoside 3-N-acetyltransferase